MQPGEQAVHRPHPPLRGHHQIRPPGRRPHPPVRPGRRLQGPYGRRPHGHHAPARGTRSRPPPRPRRVHQPCRRRRHREPLRIRRLERLRRRHPRVQRERREPHPRTHQPRHQPRRERPGRTGQLRTAGAGGVLREHRLVRRRWLLLIRGPVPDRPPVVVHHLHRCGARHPPPPQPYAPGIHRRPERQPRPARQPHHPAFGAARPRPGAAPPVRGAQLHRPAPGHLPAPRMPPVRPRREMHHHRLTAPPPVPRPAVHRRRQRPRGVHHQDVPRRQQPRQLPERMVRGRGPAPAHQQPHGIQGRRRARPLRRPRHDRHRHDHVPCPGRAVRFPALAPNLGTRARAGRRPLDGP